MRGAPLSVSDVTLPYKASESAFRSHSALPRNVLHLTLAILPLVCTWYVGRARLQARGALHRVHRRRGQARAGQAAHREGLHGGPVEQDGNIHHYEKVFTYYAYWILFLPFASWRCTELLLRRTYMFLLRTIVFCTLMLLGW